jgi:hypothetical protein
VRLGCLQENFHYPPPDRSGTHLPDMSHKQIVHTHTHVGNTNIAKHLLVHSAANENTGV